MVSPLLSVVLVYLGIMFVSKGFCGLDFRVKALAKQPYRAIFINCQDMVSCWKTVAVKKSKNDRAVSNFPR